jgi:hypothetical protein
MPLLQSMPFVYWPRLNNHSANIIVQTSTLPLHCTLYTHYCTTLPQQQQQQQQQQQAEEEQRALLLQQARHQRHVTQLDLHCTAKAAAESAAAAKALKLRQHAVACTAALSAATSWRQRCLVARHRAGLWKIRVLKDTAYFHGRALTGALVF